MRALNCLIPNSLWLSVTLPLILSPLTFSGTSTDELEPAIESSPLAALSLTSLDWKEICDEPRTLLEMLFLMSALSLSPSGLAPPVPSMTSSEPGSAVSLIEGLSPPSTVASQLVTPRTRSCPAFAAAPSLDVLTFSEPLLGPKLCVPSGIDMGGHYPCALDALLSA